MHPAHSWTYLFHVTLFKRFAFTRLCNNLSVSCDLTKSYGHLKRLLHTNSNVKLKDVSEEVVFKMIRTCLSLFVHLSVSNPDWQCFILICNRRQDGSFSITTLHMVRSMTPRTIDARLLRLQVFVLFFF